MLIFRQTRLNILIPFMMIAASVTYGRVGDGMGSQEAKEEVVNVAIRDLSGPEENGRLAAKARLLEMGDDAVPALVTFLRDLLQNPTPRYEIGKEAEEEQRGKEFSEALKKEDYKAVTAAMREYSQHEISQRLRHDVIELLGKLQAKQAIPPLVAQLGCCDAGFSSIGRFDITDAMAALVGIGSPAVPELIRALQQDQAETPRQKSKGRNKWDRAEALARVGYYRRRALQILYVLDQIGDPAALPDLENIKQVTKNDFLIPYINKTVREINERR